MNFTHQSVLFYFVCFANFLAAIILNRQNKINNIVVIPATKYRPFFVYSNELP